VLGKFGGDKQAEARKLAERLAGDGDSESSELKALLRDPVSNVLNWGAGVAVYAILALMIWKPGQ
jgi:hypothetical protein